MAAKRILVTGGAGYVGTSVVRELLQAGFSVRVFDDLTYGGQGLFGFFGEPGFTLQKGDVCSESQVAEAVREVDVIVHLAAVVGVGACDKNPERAHGVNTTGTDLLANVRRKDQPIVFASTASAYGTADGVCDENRALEPQTSYSRSKIEAERRLLNSGNVVVFRYGSGFGVAPRLRLDVIVNSFVHQAVREGTLVVYEGAYRRSFIHVRDMAESVHFAVDNFGRLRDGTFNCGTEENNHSKAGIARLVQQRVKTNVHFAQIDRDPEQSNSDVSFEKLRRAGFAARRTVPEGIDELIAAMDAVESPNWFTNTSRS